MSHALVIRVHFHDGRYHGAGDWPPSPARLFQALVSAAGMTGQLANRRDALKWFEELPTAPIIGAPNAWRGQRVMFYMPNNDLDAVRGDPRRAAKIRTAQKYFNPWLFDASTPLLYVWHDVERADEPYAQQIVLLADDLYQLGRGIDMAWAWGELLHRSRADEVIASHAGPVYRPSAGGAGTMLPCPGPGSLTSTEKRYRAYRRRFEIERKGKTTKLTFRQPPRSTFRSIAYESPPSRRVYELRRPSGDSLLASWPLSDVSRLVVCLRNGAVDRLATALPSRSQEIERVLVGRKPDGTNDGRTTDRVRIMPLPSIGHAHADRAIRRILVDVPTGCSIRADDLNWAFLGLEPMDPDTGEVHPFVVTPTASDHVLRHYGIGNAGARTWRTVTPAALSDAAGRRRLDSARKLAEGTGGAERLQERQRAATAAIQALRHAEVRAPVESIRVQREPFEGNGERVEPFAAGTRFPKERLWHLEIRFTEPVSGPLVVGDGRFLGLGLMAPFRHLNGVHAFAVEAGIVEKPASDKVARALRRAVMARVQETLRGSRVMSPFFSGHERDGMPARAERHPHLAFLFDNRGARFFVIAPHVMDRRTATNEEQGKLDILEEALRGFRELRAGSDGVFAIRPTMADIGTDPLFSASQVWESATPYQVTRHARGVGAHEALAIDVRAECRRRGLPEPVDVRVLEAQGVAGVGLKGRVRIVFAVAVKGPVLLGRSRYLGGGLFEGRRSERMQAP